MDINRVLEKLGWITQMKSTPPLTDEYKERQYSFFKNYVQFLQEKGFTTRVLLKSDEKPTDDSEIKVGDLTDEGLKFYLFGIRKWREKYDKAKDKDKVINDFSFIENKLEEFNAKNK